MPELLIYIETTCFCEDTRQAKDTVESGVGFCKKSLYSLKDEKNITFKNRNLC